ncbi:MAG: hypothetical protein ACE5IH_08715 [Thermodesulfobacteriota bacterium]
MIEKRIRQHFFAARELQTTIAFLVIVALLGGILLQVVSKSLSNLLGLETPYLTVFLLIGYTVIVVLCALFFTHRLVGPFKRLEYEMKLITRGGFDRRLTIRTQDDWHVRSFIVNVNSLLDDFEKISKDCSELSSTLSQCLEEIINKLEVEAPLNEIKTSIKHLQQLAHKIEESGS